MKGAFKKNQGNGQGGADSLDIRQKGGMQRDSAGFGFFPFFLFCGLNGNKAGIVEGEGEHLTRAHTCENEKPETKLCTGLRLFCEKSADKFAWNNLSGGALVRLDLYFRHDVNGQKPVRDGSRANPIQNTFSVLRGAKFAALDQLIQKLLAVGGGKVLQELVPEKAGNMPPYDAGKVVKVLIGNIRLFERFQVLQSIIGNGKSGNGQDLRSDGLFFGVLSCLQIALFKEFELLQKLNFRLVEKARGGRNTNAVNL